MNTLFHIIRGHWRMILISAATTLISTLLLLWLLLIYLVGSPVSFFKFAALYRTVKADYYKPVTDEQLWKGAQNGLILSLNDKYSSVLTGDEFQSFTQQTSGEYEGVGIILGEDAHHQIIVLSVLPNSPAQKAGIQSGDMILSVGGTKVSDLGLSQISSAIRGQAGTEVSLTLQRDSETRDFTLQRSKIPLPSVDSSMLDHGIGYIHIYSFAVNTPEEIKSALSNLKSQGASRLIIDLRMNPGGMVQSVAGVANQLLTRGTVVSYVMKNGHRQEFDVDGIEKPLPMVFLIDKNSASAAEILAGDAQDKKEGVIMGQKSYGKGTVQQVIYEDQDSLIKVSVAEYHTAGGRSIDKVGIIPDIPVEQTGRIFDLSSDSVLQAAESYLISND